jgi:MFS family permease
VHISLLRASLRSKNHVEIVFWNAHSTYRLVRIRGSWTTSFAYISDVAPPEKRASAFGMVGAAFGVGFILGPAVGGVLGDIVPLRATVPMPHRILMWESGPPTSLPNKPTRANAR